MGDKEITDGIEHVAYEMMMLVGSLTLVSWTQIAALEIDTEGRLAAWAAGNAHVELRALHARNVAEFLLCTASKRTNLRADLYIKGFKTTERDAVQEIYKRACVEIAHLGRTRVTEADNASGEGSKSWPPAEVFPPLLRSAAKFVEALLAEERWKDIPELRRTQLDVAAKGMRALVSFWKAVPPPCDSCGSAQVVPIVYGEPRPEHEQARDRGDVVLGGRLFGEDSPTWKCFACRTDFGRLGKLYPERFACKELNDD